VLAAGPSCCTASPTAPENTSYRDRYKYPVLKQAVFRISLSADSDPDPALGFSIAPEANILPFFFLCFANANLFISYYGTVP
jgi:hypothetical protein